MAIVGTCVTENVKIVWEEERKNDSNNNNKVNATKIKMETTLGRKNYT